MRGLNFFLNLQKVGSGVLFFFACGAVFNNGNWLKTPFSRGKTPKFSRASRAGCWFFCLRRIFTVILSLVRFPSSRRLKPPKFLPPSAAERWYAIIGRKLRWAKGWVWTLSSPEGLSSSSYVRACPMGRDFVCVPAGNRISTSAKISNRQHPLAISKH